MKSLLLIFCLINTDKCSDTTIVYICDSQNASKYHYKADCRGLSNCQFKIIKTTLEKAQKSKTLCGWEKP